MQKIGERLHYIRKKRGYSQEALAAKIGVSRGVIFNLEQNKSKPQEIVINAICNTLNINKVWLITGAGEINYTKNEVLEELLEVAQKLTKKEQLYLLESAKLFNKYFNQ